MDGKDETLLHQMKQAHPTTLERPLYLLGFFTRERPLWRLSALSDASGLPKASVLRAIRALEAHGLLKREGDDYRLGPRLISLGSLAKESAAPRNIAADYLRSLRDMTEQSVQWVVRHEYEGVYLDVFEPRKSVRLFIAPGRHAPLYAGASTRLLLAFAPDAVINHVLTRPLKRHTSATPSDAAKLRRLVRQTRKCWFAISFAELTPSTAELSAPVFGPGQHIEAAISIAGAEAYFRESETLGRYLGLLDHAAEAISRDLGFEGKWKSRPDLLRMSASEMSS